MTEWHTISAKFTSKEKKILDILRDEYGLSHNQSLRGGLELFARILAMCEYYVMSDGKIVKKLSRVGEKSIKQMDADVKKILKNIPHKQQEAEYEKFTNDSARIFSQFDKVFVKNRKKGRTPKKRTRGKPKDTGREWLEKRHNLSLLDKKSDSSVIAQMEYIISIAKRYNHAKTHYKDPRNRGSKGAKPVLGIYYLNEEMKLRFRKISRLMIPYYRARIWKRRVFVCLECGYKFAGLVKKDTDDLDCPNCEIWLRL